MGTVAGTKAKYPDACLIWVSACSVGGGDACLPNVEGPLI